MRRDRGQSRVVPPQLAELIERLKRENPHRTGTTLLRELALVSGNDSPAISAATLYRFLHQRGLTTRQLLAAPAHKKFEAEFSNQIWQSDMLFGPYVQRAGGGRMQVFLYAILDDASRLIPHAQFYTHQGLDAFLDCLRQAVAARGLPTRLYVDNAKVYRSQQLARIAASIGILITHTPPYQPEGRGKIERWFRSVREQFLANLDPRRTLSLPELNQRLWAWIEQVYHGSEHSGLGTTPLLRWQRDIEHIRQLPPSTDLRRLFFYRVARLVRRDSTFLLRGHFYEAPPQFAGQTSRDKLSKRGSIPSIYTRWRSTSRSKPTAWRGSSMPWSMHNSLRPNSCPPRLQNRPVSTSWSSCSRNKTTRRRRTRRTKNEE